MHAPLKRMPSPSRQAANSLDDVARAKLAELDRNHLRRRLTESVRTDGIWITRTFGPPCSASSRSCRT